MLRILMASHGPADPRTGVYRNIAGRAAYLRRLGHTVDVVAPADLQRLQLRRLDSLLLPLALARRVPAYDLVIFHSYLGWVFHAARRWLDPAGRVATVTAFHGLEPLYFRAIVTELSRTGERVTLRFRLLQAVLQRMLAFTCRASDAVLCLNAAERAYVIDEGWAEPERVSIVTNEFDRTLLRPRTHREHASRLLFLGQWLRAKGIRYLVEAFQRAAATRDVYLTCLGTGAAADTVLAAFPETVRARVTVLPSVDQDDIARALGDADVFVFPSLSEGSSTALLEAMAAALPIVTTAAGAAPEILADGESALFVPHADAAALASAIERLLGDAPLRRRLGDAAQRKAAEMQSNGGAAHYVDCVTRAHDRRVSRAAAPDLEHVAR